MSTTFNQRILEEYSRKFQRLRRANTPYGKAPHKPVFLLTVIELIEEQVITDNKIGVTPELVATFKENFALLDKTAHKDDFTQPFFYLQGDGFWFLKPKPGVVIDAHIRSVQTLSERLDYAYLKDELFYLLRDAEARLQLKHRLLDTFFADTKQAFLRVKNSGHSYFQAIESAVLNEKEPGYGPVLPTEDEETRFVRGGLFKRLVPKVYAYSCAISDLKVITRENVTLVEACHIVPISISGNDTVTNGITLCPTLHTAFDKGMIGVDEQYRVIVSTVLQDNLQSPYNLRQFHGKTIRLPLEGKHYPEKENFRWHLENRFIG